MSVFNGPITSGVLNTVDRANTSASYFAPAGSGGGGSSGSQISSIGAYVLCSTNGALYMGNTGVGTADIQIGDTGNTVGINIQNATNDQITLFSGSISFTTQNVVMGSTNLNVSSINSAAYPPAVALPEDAGFNNLECSTIGVNTSLSVGGFTQPIILYGATTLNGSGTASVLLDRQYADPYYPFVTYRGTLGATTSTLSVSTINSDTFAIYGEANTQVQYMVLGN